MKRGICIFLGLVVAAAAVGQTNEDEARRLLESKRWQITLSYPIESRVDGEDEFVADEFLPRFTLLYRELHDQFFYEGTVRWRKQGFTDDDLFTLRAGVRGFWDSAKRVRWRVVGRAERNLDNTQRRVLGEVRFYKSGNGQYSRPRQLAWLHGVGLEYLGRIKREKGHENSDYDWHARHDIELDYFFQRRRRYAGQFMVPSFPVNRLYLRNVTYLVDPVPGPQLRNVLTAGYTYQPNAVLRYGIEGRIGASITSDSPDRFLRLYTTIYF